MKLSIMHTINIAKALIIFVLMLLAQSGSGWAAIVEQKTASGMAINAEYLPADSNKPALLVLHGFLQTFDFMATRNIVNGLSALDYTVLAPNLSLGVPNRKQSMQCQAPHSNTFNDDLAEIDFWINWLQQKGYNSVILVGHSWGSQHSLGYKLQNPDSPVSAIIAISLVRSHQASQLHAQQVKDAQLRVQKGQTALQPYKLSFCKEYMATPQNYLSYSQWNDDGVTVALSRLKQQKLPVHVIIGGADKRTDPEWLQQIQPRVSSIKVIEGANHFFSHVHEFDLNDQLENVLTILVP